MGLYTKIDKQLDNYYEIVSINRRFAKRNFYLKVVILFLLIFNVIMFIKRFIQSIHNSIIFFFIRYFV